MKKNIFGLFILAGVLAACQNGGQEMVDCSNCTQCNESAQIAPCANCIAGGRVQYSMPNGNDLVLETSKRVLHIEAQPNKKYDYYVWTGDKSYEEDPDLIVQEGVAAVLVTE